MGQQFQLEIDNQSGYVFDGTTLNVQCMFNTFELARLEKGVNNFGLLFDDAGKCFFQWRYVVQGFALPGTDPGKYLFFFGLFSRGVPRPKFGPDWFVTERSWEGRTAYLGTAPRGLVLHFKSFETCGHDGCIHLLVESRFGDAPLESVHAVHAPLQVSLPGQDGPEGEPER